MFCSNCGKEIDDKAIICVHCGVATHNMAATASEIPQKEVNPFGVAGFVTGFLSLWFGALLCIPSVVGLVLSIVGLTKKKKYNSANGLATAGLVLSIISLVMWLAWWIVMTTTGMLWQIVFNL